MSPEERENLEIMYAKYGWRCFVSGERAMHRAHIIGQTVLNYRRYGTGVIDNPLNWRPVANLKYNKMIDAGFIRSRLDAVAEMIRNGDEKGIDEFLKENIKRRGYVPQD